MNEEKGADKQRSGKRIIGGGNHWCRDPERGQFVVSSVAGECAEQKERDRVMRQGQMAQGLSSQGGEAEFILSPLAKIVGFQSGA